MIAQQAAMAQARFGTMQAKQPVQQQEVSTGSESHRISAKLSGDVADFVFRVQRKKFDSADYFGQAAQAQENTGQPANASAAAYGLEESKR